MKPHIIRVEFIFTWSYVDSMFLFSIEGVGALLIRKDNAPKWIPARIEDVTEKQVLSFFQPLPNDEALPM